MERNEIAHKVNVVNRFHRDARCLLLAYLGYEGIEDPPTMLRIVDHLLADAERYLGELEKALKD